MERAPVLRQNVLATYVGHAFTSLIALALAPWYVQRLGIEAWGLVGMLALLSAWLNLLDFGLTPSITREIAALGSSNESRRRAADLVRTVEWSYAGLLLPATAAVALAAPLIAQRWLRLDVLTAEAAAASIAWIAVSVALRLHENVYRAVLGGFERLGLLNVLSSVFAALRWVGGLVLLGAWEAADVIDLFVWQAGISVLSLLAFATFAYRQLRLVAPVGRFDPAALWGVRTFAGGIALSTTLGFALSQIDKILLSRLLPMADFGAYVLASSIADALALLAAPLYAALLPRFVRLHAAGEAQALGDLYLRASQLLAAALVPCGLLLIAHSTRVLEVWTGDAGRTLPGDMALLVALLATGRMLNATMQLPAALQTASGWTSLGVAINMVAVVLLLPLILIVVPSGGTVAYGVCWIVLNLVYVVAGSALMHRRLLVGRAGEWIGHALIVPLLAAAPPMALLALAGPAASRALEVLALGSALLASIALWLAALPAGRALALRGVVRRT